MSFSRLRGMQDIYGAEVKHFQLIEAAARQVFEVFGFEELRTPMLEEKELFARAIGDETDVVQKEMYEFLDRSKTLLALRPEGTAGAVRAYLENNFDKTKGLCKFYYIGPMFRSERPQAGRYRQFHQIGVEQLGTDSPYADAETLEALCVFLSRLGVKDFKIRLNNLGSSKERSEFGIVLKEYFSPKKEGLCADCQRRLEKNVFRILDCKNESCRELVKKSPLIKGVLSEESKGHFSKVGRALKACGISYEEAPTLVRGLDYYTKTVFEISHPALGAQDALAAGGRYDHLIESFGGAASGAVGFAVGVERLAMCLDQNKTVDDSSDKIFFIAALGEKASEEGFLLLSKIRGAGLKASMDFQNKSLKSQMRQADKIGSRYVVILGDDEIKKGIFLLKDMKTGNQEEHGISELVKILSGKRNA